MDEEIKRVYSAFGYDVSKGLRKVSDITDGEAMNVGKILDRELGWWVKDRKNGGLELSSVEKDRKIYITKSGDIEVSMFKDPDKYFLARQYLISRGINQPILTRDFIEDILKKSPTIIR